MEKEFQTIDIDTHIFEVPVKTIITIEDLELFKKSPTFNEIIGFIMALQKSVEGATCKEAVPSEYLVKIDDLLAKLSAYADEVKPLTQPMRFGNKAFKIWLDKVKDNFSELMNPLLPTKYKKAEVELKEYFIDCFGSYDRIDYGTGHELNFIAFLYILVKCGLIKKADFKSLILKTFMNYNKLIRKLLDIYVLEPAGSHGVWGIDDYIFLPFLFGASQLLKSSLTPQSIREDALQLKYEEEYMYFSCVRYIRSVKKSVPFSEGSPLLYDISGAPSWTKVSRGMVKMYCAEVMQKHPIIKHMRFGSILKFVPKK